MAFDPNFRMNRIDQGPSMTEIVNRGAGGILSRQVDRMTAAEDKARAEDYRSGRNKILDTRAKDATDLAAVQYDKAQEDALVRDELTAQNRADQISNSRARTSEIIRSNKNAEDVVTGGAYMPLLNPTKQVADTADKFNLPGAKKILKGFDDGVNEAATKVTPMTYKDYLGADYSKKTGGILGGSSDSSIADIFSMDPEAQQKQFKRVGSAFQPIDTLLHGQSQEQRDAGKQSSPANAPKMSKAEWEAANSPRTNLPSLPQALDTRLATDKAYQKEQGLLAPVEGATKEAPATRDNLIKDVNAQIKEKAAAAKKAGNPLSKGILTGMRNAAKKEVTKILDTRKANAKEAYDKTIAELTKQGERDYEQQVRVWKRDNPDNKELTQLDILKMAKIALQNEKLEYENSDY